MKVKLKSMEVVNLLGVNDNLWEYVLGMIEKHPKEKVIVSLPNGETKWIEWGEIEGPF